LDNTIRRLRREYPNAVIRAYLDDLTIVVDKEEAVAVLQIAKEELNKVGLSINMKKTEILVDKWKGPKPRLDDGQAVKLSEASTRVVGTFVPAKDDMRDLVTQQIHKRLRESTEPLFTSLQAMGNDEELNAKEMLAIIRQVICTKGSYLVRTHDAELTKNATEWLDLQVLSTIRAYTRCDVTPISQLLLEQPLRNGGLGVTNMTKAAPIAHAAAKSRNKKAQLKAMRQHDDKALEALRKRLSPAERAFQVSCMQTAGNRIVSDPAVRLSNAAAKVMVCERIAQRCLPEGFLCKCHADADNYHVHTCNVIGGGAAIHRHNSVVSALSEALTAAKVEHMLEPSNLDSTQKTRPDILFTNASGVAIAVDVTVTTPQQYKKDASKPFAAASMRAAEKRKKYTAQCAKAGQTFIPAVFESTGAIHEDALQVIRHISGLMAANLPAHQAQVAYDTMMTRISEAIASGNADLYACAAYGEVVRYGNPRPMRRMNTAIAPSPGEAGMSIASPSKPNTWRQQQSSSSTPATTSSVAAAEALFTTTAVPSARTVEVVAAAAASASPQQDQQQRRRQEKNQNKNSPTIDVNSFHVKPTPHQSGKLYAQRKQSPVPPRPQTNQNGDSTTSIPRVNPLLLPPATKAKSLVPDMVHVGAEMEAH
jgi:hypothetical protein